ncbi:putative peptidyl-prolyl cis-trans isomerase FKBP62-like isoform 1 [Capsicum annuum]|nr:putative peptidyl-prolyl cis-trans isomerase FKBP62-like isoform 1 [Capsicum annuum]
MEKKSSMDVKPCSHHHHRRHHHHHYHILNNFPLHSYMLQQGNKHVPACPLFTPSLQQSTAALLPDDLDVQISEPTVSYTDSRFCLEAKSFLRAEGLSEAVSLPYNGRVKVWVHPTLLRPCLWDYVGHSEQIYLIDLQQKSLPKRKGRVRSQMGGTHQHWRTDHVVKNESAICP